MSLAEYYERAALAAAQVIAGFDSHLFRKKLERAKVGIAIGRQAAISGEGKALADLVVRLFARLYPSLEIRVGVSTEAERLGMLARDINPHIEFTQGAPIGVSIGKGAAPFKTTYFAGSNGWDALLSLREPVQSGSSRNPFGAGAAACLAASNVFKRLLMADWELRITRDVCFSTFNREKKATSREVPRDKWKFVDDAVLVGLGAIGNGAVWALGRAPIDGSLHIVDPESLELSNLQRYVLSVRNDVGKPKTHLAASHFWGPLAPIPHEMTWARFVQEFGYRWNRALVSVDTAADRRSIQATLPEWIANSWTQPGDLGLSVHGRFDQAGACLACLYLPTGVVPNEDALVAHALGVPHLVSEIRTLLYSGAGIKRELLEAVAAGLHRPLEDVLRYENYPVRQLYAEGICGGGLIALGKAGMPLQELHVPLAHQSALAGVLLASSFVRHLLCAGDDVTKITRIDILGPLGDYLTQPSLKGGSGRCICEDRDYTAAFQTKYRPT